MAHIKTGNELPGIVEFLIFDRGTGPRISALVQEVLRRPSTLTVAEREAIATYVSEKNKCEFCFNSHLACTQTLIGSEIENVYAYFYDDPKMRSLLDLAGVVVDSGRLVNKNLIAAAREGGATDQEIHDTVLIAGLFCFLNRYVDGLGGTFESIEEVREDGRLCAELGYKWSLKRLRKQIIPAIKRSILKKHGDSLPGWVRSLLKDK